MSLERERIQRLKELAFVFLKLGTTAFGGPAAHIAMMEEEVVRRRKWVSESKFIDFLGATNLIPGPNSTEMAIHIGYERAGFTGLIIAGTCFIVPAMLIVLLIAWGYVTYGKLPEVQSVFYGVKPVILAVVSQAIWNLTRKMAREKMFLVWAALALAASLFGLGEIPVLIGIGFLALARVWFRANGKGAVSRLDVFTFAPLKTVVVTSPVFLVPFSNAKLFWFFLKVGSVLYGSGYVLLAFLQGELVHKYGWITQGQLLDATAVGQFTPGPVFTTATFIGYLLSGFYGASLATLGIFLPSFFFVGFSTRLIPWLRKNAFAGGFLDGVNAASLGLMGAVTIQLGRGALIDIPTVLLAIISAVILIVWKVNSVWLVISGGLLGWVLSSVQ